MKNQSSPIIDVRGLIFIYALLSVLTILLFRVFLGGLLYDGSVPDSLSLFVFFTIPAVVLIFLAISTAHLGYDFLKRRVGRRFQVKLLGYFFLTAIFAAVPLVIITSQSISEIFRFWWALDAETPLNYAQQFAVDAYALRVEKLERLATETSLDPQMENNAALAEGVLAIQDFSRTEGGWTSLKWVGSAGKILQSPPIARTGLAPREQPRDANVVRYVVALGGKKMRVITYDLGDGFDKALASFDSEKSKLETVNSLDINIQLVLFFFYGVFFLPTVLMTFIIAISFTRTITKPIIELTEATDQVAQGDFSIHIMARHKDEFGLLIRSFNSMVHELEKTRSSLVNAEKISIWQKMAAQLAHEIKNPLTPIKLSAERVLRRWQNSPEQIGGILEDSMLAIIQEVEGLSAMLTEFRTLSRPMEPSLASVAVAGLIRSLVPPYRLSYPSITFDIDHIDESVKVKIDERRFSQILTNLIINAIDAVDADGKVSRAEFGGVDVGGTKIGGVENDGVKVDGSTGGAEKYIEIRTDIVKKLDIAYCRISVRDTGKGISKEDGGKIFTPYFTTKESGTGLGLPIIERIVNEHGGAVWFNSAPGLGTTFFVDLPAE